MPKPKSVEDYAYGQWLVNVLGEAEASYEIAVVHAGFLHGFGSYGWDGPHKLIISSSGGPCAYTVPKFVFDKLVLIAAVAAEEMTSRTDDSMRAE